VRPVPSGDKYATGRSVHGKRTGCGTGRSSTPLRPLPQPARSGYKPLAARCAAGPPRGGQEVIHAKSRQRGGRQAYAERGNPRRPRPQDVAPQDDEGGGGGAGAMALLRKDAPACRLGVVLPEELRSYSPRGGSTVCSPGPEGVQREVQEGGTRPAATPPVEGVLYGTASTCPAASVPPCVYACVRENNQIRDPQITGSACCSSTRSAASTSRRRSTTTTPRRSEKGQFYMPVQCQQCEYPPCREGVPGAGHLARSVTRITVVDYNWCIGCRYGHGGLPYGAPTSTGRSRRSLPPR